jgi:hypothetical protein
MLVERPLVTPAVVRNNLVQPTRAVAVEARMGTPSYQQILAENQQLRERNTRLEQTVADTFDKPFGITVTPGAPGHRLKS